MNPPVIDAIIVCVVGLGIAYGMLSGLVRGVLALICGVLTLVLVLAGYAPVAQRLVTTFNLSTRTAFLLAFGTLILLAQLLCSQVIHRATRPLITAIDRPGPGRTLDRLLGAVPGGLFALLAVSVVLAPVSMTLALPGLGAAIRDARLAPHLLRADAAMLERFNLRERLGTATAALGGPVVAPATESGRALPFTVPASDLAPDPAGEAQLFALVNGERERVGLRPLVWDPALMAIARQHATEMFELGYFAHDSPITGSPFDRMAKAGIRFRAAGENLAFAPSVDVAHRSLMNSPGHRANILSPDFGRGGFGIIRSREFGLMIVQEFRNGAATPRSLTPEGTPRGGPRCPPLPLAQQFSQQPDSHIRASAPRVQHRV